MIKGLFICLSLCFALPLLAQNQQGGDDLQEIRKRQLELMQRIRKQLEADQSDMDQFFNDQFFKQADQMFKQLQDDKSPFGQIIQQFQKGFMGEFEGSHSPSQWKESDAGMAFVLPYILTPQDKIDLKINKNEVSIEIERQRTRGVSRSQSYQFPIPKGCDPAGVEILNKEKEGQTHILFPWKKKLEKVKPSAGDKVI